MVILPFTILRRLDCTFNSAKPHSASPLPAEQYSYNNSTLDLTKLLSDQENILQNLYLYIQGFPQAVRDIFERFDFYTKIEHLAKIKLLYLVLEKFVELDLHPDVVSNVQMSRTFEELINKFSEISGEAAGEHFTPRDIIKLMVNLLFINDSALAPGHAVTKTIYDPTAGTGGMLSLAAQYLSDHNPEACLSMFAQELNDESYAICKADMFIKGQNINNIVAGNTLSADGHSTKKFDYILSNAPFGVDWRKIEKVIRQEHEIKGFEGRFGPGLPRLSDSTLLFVLNLIDKMKAPSGGGSRICTIVTDSALRSGSASSGESNIRKWIVDNDFLDCIVALPTDIFFNTTIQTYILVLNNNKKRDGIKLVNASASWEPMRASIGCKSRYISDAYIDSVLKLFGEASGDFVKIISKRDLLYRNFRTEIGGNLISRNVSLNKNEADYLRLTENFGIDVKTEKNLEIGCEIDFFSFFSNHEAKWASTLPLVALVEACDSDASWDLAVKASGILFRPSWDGRSEISKARFFKVRRDVISPKYLEIYISERSIKEVGTSRKIPTIAAHLEMRIECPLLKKQQSIVEFYGQKNEFIVRLARIEQEQWSDSVDACIFKHRISEYADGAEYMAKILPHPLASLLYKVQCEKSKRELLDGYRVFFECLGAVLSSIALGVIYASKTDKDCYDILVSRGKLNRPTMGSYQNILRKTRERSSDIVGFGSYVLSVVASVEVEEILISCTNIRNEIAHRGLIKSSELGEYVDRFKRALNRVSDILSDFFSENFVAKQLHQKWNGVLFENEVLALSGIASYPFERKIKDSVSPLIAGELYLFQGVDERNGADNHVRLFHFMKCVEIIDGSDNEGFYFLNSFEAGGGGAKTICNFSSFQPLIESKKIIDSEMWERIHSLKK